MATDLFDIEPLDATFGAVVTGVELRSIEGVAFEALQETWLEHALLIFPGQFLTIDEQNDFARRFGPLEFEAVPFSNVDAEGNILSDPGHDVVKSLRGNEGWHHDSTYMPLQAKGSVFTAEVVTSLGGATGWADMRAAYEALDPETQQRLAGLRAHHSLYYSQGRSGYMPKKTEGGGYDMYGFHDLEPPLRPLVKVHPETGRPNLLAGRHAYGIVGMAEDESEAFLDRLNAQACQPPRIHHHQWAAGDAALWDNRRLMHRGTPFDMTEPRVMWHTRIAGDPASELADNHQGFQQRSGIDVMGEDTLIVG
ncbi:MAG: TauD/TfdA family dioxygenase [Acidimicrobiaceae bacterium]|nr:TauD/TfdA family dioxygenase [Acidimicrobiaceae bacterium]MYG99091.1 TauD/TfdA family dioxygenase [Acidimicrobiaceae bacterium]MYL03611.1 TauD/TfdA family dioxygenase [Acidimicrobiaceae bacterium]